MSTVQIALSAKKKKKSKNPRSKFLSAFMREISGDFGEQVIDAFMKGQNEKLGELWNELGTKMKKKASGQKAAGKRKSTSATKKFPHVRSIRDTEIHTWFERDRAAVELRDKKDNTIVEWLDDDVKEAVDDGFLDPRDWHESAYEYAEQHGII